VAALPTANSASQRLKVARLDMQVASLPPTLGPISGRCSKGIVDSRAVYGDWANAFCG
jgi:hypothetical protein